MNERLRTSMARQAITVDVVASHAEVDPKTVQRWLAGRTPHARHRCAVAALLDEDEPYLWPETVTTRPSASAAELVALYGHRADVPFDLWWQLFEHAQQHIDVLVYAAPFLHEQYPMLNSLLAERCTHGCSVRVALGDPDCQAVRNRGSEEAFGEGIESRCRMAQRHFRPLVGKARFELRLHRSTLYNSIYRFDSQILVNIHIWGANAYSAPVLHLRQVQGGSLFAAFASSFESVWAAAVAVELPTVASS